MRVALIGAFGLRRKMTMTRRALPLARALVARGHSVRVVVPPWDCPEDSGRVWVDAGVEVVNIRLPPRLPAVAHLWMVARLLRAALAFRPQLLHCFKPKAYAGLVASAVRALQRLQWWAGRLLIDADDWEGCAGWRNLVGYSWGQQRFFEWQEQWGLRHCDAVTVASRWLENRVATIREGANNVWYLPNGVGQEIVTVRRVAKLAPTVLLYTRFVECDETVVLGIWRRVIQEIPTARLLVAGAGLQQEELELVRLASREGLSDQIELLGWVNSWAMSAILAGVDVAMQPVVDTDLARAKCPARLLDLMAAGIPVVTQALGEYAEIVDDGISGVLVPPGDQPAMAVALIGLLQDADQRSRMGAAAQERARTLFAWEDLVVQLEQAYCALSEENGRS